MLAGELNFSKRLIESNLHQQLNSYQAQLAPTLLFNDSETAKEIIETITFNPLITEVNLWKNEPKDGENALILFASSRNSEVSQPNFIAEEKWETNALRSFKKISSGKEMIGYLSVTRSLSDLSTRTDQFINFGLLSWFVILTVIVVVTLWYQNSLTHPMQELMSVAEKISTEKNYKHRAQQNTNDEFGRLIKIFNQMLDSLNSANEKLIQAKAQMENKVEIRTKELSESNSRLLKEMDERERTHNELLAAKEKLNLQERLASVGQVSSNIAHELRNPMTAIRNAVYFLRSRIAHDPKVSHNLDIIDNELTLGDAVIERLLELTKGKELKLTMTNLKKVVREAIMVTNLSSEIKFEVKIDREVQKLLLDPVLFRQILSNLFTNSMQAIPHSGIIQFIASKNYNNEAEIRILDTGCGIPKNNWKKIFDPLFTNKKEGIGIGLSLCREIIERHNGNIEVKESSPKGTCILIKIPMVPDPVVTI